MNRKLPFADKGSRAVVTLVGSLARVAGHFVPSPVTDAGVPLLTALGAALEGFLFGVRTLVLVQRFAGLGLVRTVAAAEGGFGVPVPDVALEVLAAGKLFSAFDALVLLRGVALHVRVQDGRRGEAFVADGARVGTRAGVTEFVGGEGGFAWFGEATNGTDVTFERSLVATLVLLEQG